ncbi:MAG: guanylate kinase [Bacteroidales bacterium]|nr:guanylate kinase [Bacteroidales bacterium]
MENKNKVVIFCAPSGGGKSTIVRHIMELYPEMEFSISAASRSPRGTEKDGVEYYFISADEFRRLIADDQFVEYQEVYAGNYYGTLKREVERIWAAGHPIIFDVDVKGGVNLKKYFGDRALSIFITAPSMEILEKRLRGRGTDSEEAICTRLAKAQSEIEYARGKFDCYIVNDKLEQAFAEAEEVVGDFLK